MVEQVKQPIISSSNKRISQYFKQYEVVRSSTADRMGFDNQIYSPRVAYQAELLARNVLDKVRKNFGPLSPTSWFRCEELERHICQTSFANWCEKRGLSQDRNAWITYFMRKQHPQGGAADIEVMGVSNDDLFQWIKDNLEFDQLIREFPKEGEPMSGWVHVSWAADGENRKQAFTIGG